MARRAAGLAVVLALLGRGGWAVPVPVAYDADRLSVHVDQAPLGDVIERVGRATGAEIRGEVLEPHDLTVHFDGMPLAYALHRLLGGQNFALKYGPGGRLRAIELLGTPGPPVATVPVLVAEPGTTLPRRLGFPRRFP